MQEVTSTVIPLILAASSALPAAWITLGARDNLLHPDLNETFTAEVVSMARMQRDYPESFARLHHRAIISRSLQRTLFRLIVASEVAVAIAMWLGVLLLLLASAGIVPLWMATLIAAVAMVGFVGIWSAMLICGNHFCYWFCHEGTQVTHFHLVIWGMGNLLALILVP